MALVCARVRLTAGCLFPRKTVEGVFLPWLECIIFQKLGKMPDCTACSTLSGRLAESEVARLELLRRTNARDAELQVKLDMYCDEQKAFVFCLPPLPFLFYLTRSNCYLSIVLTDFCSHTS